MFGSYFRVAAEFAVVANCVAVLWLCTMVPFTYYYCQLCRADPALEMIPMENKKAYLEALRLAPRLIKEESDPVKFLRCRDYNPWISARSLVMYWEERKKWFKTRWLLPLNDTGAGALDSDDCDLLKSRWLVYVTPHDPSKGRYMLINHGVACPQPLEARARVVFFLGSMATDKAAQTCGLRVIRLVPSKEVAFSNRQLADAQVIATMMQSTLPIKLRGVLIVDLQPKNGMSGLVDLGLNQINSSFRALFHGQDSCMVSVSNVAQAAEKLQVLGVPPDALPLDHGGCWSYDKIFDWKRVLGEQDDVTRYVKIPWVVDTNPADEDKIKEVNALYARRAYQKRKVKQAQTQKEVRRLRTENERLRKDNAVLESLLQQAIDVATTVQNSTKPQLPDIDVGDEVFDAPLVSASADFDSILDTSLDDIFD